MKTIAIVNQKGGVGKTTISAILLSFLSKEKLKVLGIDIDPQSNLSVIFLKQLPNGPSSYDLLLGKSVEPLKLKEFDLVPSTLRLARVDQELSGVVAREYRLLKGLSKIKSAYDVIVIDTPPSLSLLTLNALLASDGIIVPTEAKFLGIVGLSHLWEVLREIKEYTDKEIDIIGIVPNLFEKQVNLQRDVLKKLRELQIKVFHPIPKRSTFQYFSLGERSLDALDSSAKKAIKDLIEGVLEWLKKEKVS
jgi:chromosome partitioning protein